MRVICRNNQLPQSGSMFLREHTRRHVHLSQIDVSLGAAFAVLGVFFREGVPWYLICEQPNDEFPTPHCSWFFDLVDSAIPSDWHLVLNESSNVGQTAILPREWASDAHFLEKLVDGDGDAISQFQQIKTRYEN